MTGVALAAILAFGAGAIEGLIRGGGITSVADAALAGLVWATITAGVRALAAGLRWVLPAELRTGAWARAGALALVVFAAGEFAVARGLALRFRDPALVALVAAGAGVVLAWLCALVVVPLAARGVALAERFSPGPRRARGLRGVGLVVVLGGAAALAGGRGAARSERPRSELVAWTIALAGQITPCGPSGRPTDLDGEGDASTLPPRG